MTVKQPNPITVGVQGGITAIVVLGTMAAVGYSAYRVYPYAKRFVRRAKRAIKIERVVKETMRNIDVEAEYLA